MQFANATNILLTSLGRRVELVRAFRSAYDALGLEGNIIATEIDPLAPALGLVDSFYIVPKTSSPAYLPTISEICERDKVDCIFPLIDPDILALASGRSEIEPSGARLAVVSESVAQLTADKWITDQYFRQNDIRTPQSWLPESLPPEPEFPLFIKPRRGSAAKHSFKASNLRELQFFISYVPDPIIQEFLPGPEITNDVICDLEGRVLGLVSRQRIEVRWGEVAKGVTVHCPEVASECIRIAELLPAIGPITIQCILDIEGQPRFTDINARFGGGVPLGIRSGVNSPLWLLASISGQTISLPKLGSYESGLYMTRFDDSFFMTATQLADKTRSHL